MESTLLITAGLYFIGSALFCLMPLSLAALTCLYAKADELLTRHRDRNDTLTIGFKVHPPQPELR